MEIIYFFNIYTIMKIFIAATIFFITCLILDVIYDQQLWEMNTRITKYMQKQQIPGL